VNRASYNGAADRIKVHAMSEIIFVVEQAPEGGFTAHALGESIHTQADTEAELQARVRDAVPCHFDEGQAPKMIRWHFACAIK
jgi:hypothetical protein